MWQVKPGQLAFSAHYNIVITVILTYLLIFSIDVFLQTFGESLTNSGEMAAKVVACVCGAL